MFSPMQESLCPQDVTSLQYAVHSLRMGGLVAYATETFLAVGCAISKEKALKNIYALKRRSAQKPLPVLVAHTEHIARIASMSEDERHLGQLFWPGPLTLLLTAKDCVSPLITAGTGHVAVRISSHPVARALAVGIDEALVCSSANISGQSPVTQATHLDARIVAGVDAVIAPYTEIASVRTGLVPSVPSTIVRCCGHKKVRIMRAGAVPQKYLEEAGFTVLNATVI